MKTDYPRSTSASSRRFARWGCLLLLGVLLTGCAGLPYGADESPSDGLFVLQLVEHGGGRAASPAPHRAYLTEVRDDWLILMPYNYDRLAGSWKPGASQGYLLPIVSPGVAEDKAVQATLSETSLKMIFKQQGVTAYYLRS